MKQLTRFALLQLGLATILMAPLSSGHAAAPQTAAPATAGEEGSAMGMNIFGDKESPIGLYITPWKNAYAEKGLDRPARLLDEAVQPIDPGTFRRQMDYYQTISDYRRAQLKAEGPR